MEIPLFPLPKLVLFPNVVLPLHIFEERYKLMVNTCIEQDEVFGLVLLRAGAEGENENTIHRVGVTARVVRVERLEDGRMNILSEGESRFSVLRFTQKLPYWRASVSLLEDTETHPSTEALYSEVAALYRDMFILGTKLSAGQQSEVNLPGSPAELSYLVSYVLDLEAEEKQKLLEMTSAAERLQVLVEHLKETIRKLEQQIALKEIISKIRGNGDLGNPNTSGASDK